MKRYVETLGASHAKGGFTKGHAHQVTVGEKGREFIMDADSTSAWEAVLPGELSRLNSATKAQATEMLKVYAKYKNQSGKGTGQKVARLENALEVLEITNSKLKADLATALQQRSGGGAVVSGGGSKSDPLAGNDNGD